MVVIQPVLNRDNARVKLILECASKFPLEDMLKMLYTLLHKSDFIDFDFTPTKALALDVRTDLGKKGMSEVLGIGTVSLTNIVLMRNKMSEKALLQFQKVFGFDIHLLVSRWNQHSMCVRLSRQESDSEYYFAKKDKIIPLSDEAQHLLKRLEQLTSKAKKL